MRIVLFSALIVLTASCNSNSSESTDRKDGYSKTATTPEDSLFQEVMNAHDTAMAKMGKMVGYRKQFDARVDSLKKAKSGPDLQKRFAQLSTELKQAEDNMNQWMQEFSIDSAQDNPEKRVEYLSSEKVKVTKVKDEILSVVAKADSALKK